ncbi:hypothetical protein DFP73DRAFT_571942 [Morchella snyderi]|nr:hypothetical protein DFP73DRAFT_571942 [Morchella snyderi]
MVYTPEEFPRFTPLYASLVSIIYTISYVGVLYLSPLSRPDPSLHRDSPSVIRIRIRAVTVVTIAALTVTSIITALTTPRRTLYEVLSFLGLLSPTPTSILDVFRSLLLTAILFTGPLAQRLWFDVVDYGWGEVKSDLQKMFYTWTGWRNFVAAPFTEEIVFRSCLVPLHLIAGKSPISVVFLSPLYFGIAHIHHGYEFYLSHPNSLFLTIVRSLIQFAYTTLFGWFATFILLRTGSAWAVIAVHSFCNHMGLPHLGMVDGPKWRSGVYFASLLGGAWGFYTLLWTLSESPNALAFFP